MQGSHDDVRRIGGCFIVAKLESLLVSVYAKEKGPYTGKGGNGKRPLVGLFTTFPTPEKGRGIRSGKQSGEQSYGESASTGGGKKVGAFKDDISDPRERGWTDG